MTSFEIFCQTAGPVGKLNQSVHWVLFARTVVWVLFIVCVGSWSFGVEIALRLFFSIPDSLRKVMTSFEIFSQPSGLVGKPNQPVHWVLFSRIAVWVLCIVCVGSWLLVVGIALRLFFSTPDSMRKVFTSFEIFSQSDGPVGKSNQPVHWVLFSGTAVWVL